MASESTSRTLRSWLLQTAPLQPAIATNLIVEIARRQTEIEGPRAKLGLKSILVDEIDASRGRIRIAGELREEPHVACTGPGAPETDDAITHVFPSERADDDLFVLGQVAYFALTGWALPDGSEPPAHVQDLAPWVDPLLAQIVHCLFLTDPASRCPSIAELREALAPFEQTVSELEASVPLLPADASVPATQMADVAMRVEPPFRWSNIRGNYSLGSLAERHLGRTLGGRYRITRLLGEGGMGAVYEAEANGEYFAVKIIQPEIAKSHRSAAIRRFLREARASMAIESDHVVRVVDAGTCAELDAPFMVMNLLRGRDLGEVLKRVGALNPEIAVRIFVDILEGLEAAHACGVIHRDLKPANIFLHEEEDGSITPKLCDFGVAKQLQGGPTMSTELTETGGILGSPMYMSPEQLIDAKQVDAQSDLWSLAVSLYRLLANALPWEDCSSVAAVVLSINTSKIVPIQDDAPWVPPALADAVHRGLQRNRALRWRTAKDFRAALEPFAYRGRLTAELLSGVTDSTRSRIELRTDSQQTATRMVPPPQHPWRLSKRFRFVALAAGAVALTVSVAYLGFVRRGETLASKLPQRGEIHCATTTDCAPLPAPHYCAPSGRCVAMARCEANHDCLRAYDGALSVCNQARKVCTPLESEACKAKFSPGDLESDSTVWLGTMFPLSGPSAEAFGRASARAVDLARLDFAQATAPNAAQSARRIAIVECDDATDALQAARHLVDNVAVQGVIGFQWSKEVIDLATELFIPRGVVSMAALNSSSLITQIPHPVGSPRLVWRTAVSSSQNGEVIGSVVSGLFEPRVRRAAHLAPNDGVRIALLRRDSVTGVGLSDSIVANLSFNGRNVAQNERFFREFRYGDSSAPASLDSDRAMVARLGEFKPHIVILEGTTFVPEEILEALERNAVAPAERPIYLVVGALEGQAFLQMVGKSAERRRRFFAIEPPTSTPENVRFTTHYNNATGEKLLPSVAPTGPYDSFYTLAYAIHSLGGHAVSGVSLARQISRLMNGVRISIGPEQIAEGLQALASGKNIDLVGGLTTLDFELDTGEARSDFALLCTRVSASGRSVENVESGVVFSGASRTLSGHLNCP